jgi:hypothetical protein
MSENSKLPPPVDGGAPGSNVFQRLSNEQLYSIMNCIEQFIQRGKFDKTGKTFFCISVYFSADANKRYKSNTPPDGYLIQPKLTENYVNKALLAHAMELWNANLVPIEVYRDGRGAFFALPRKEVLSGNLVHMMAYAEEKIPDFEDTCADLACECCVHGEAENNATIDTKIKELGATIIAVFDATPPFVYTVGLTETFNKPEFIMIGDLDIQQMGEILGMCIDKLKKDPTHFDSIEVRGIIEIKTPVEPNVAKSSKSSKSSNVQKQDGCMGCREISKDNKEKLCGQATARYADRGFKVKQIIIPDQNNRLPWHENFDTHWGTLQPQLYDLDENRK